MKKPHNLAFVTILIITGLFFVKPENGYSQRATSKNNNISVDFIDQFIKNTISVQYEWKANSTQSWAVRGQYVTPVLNSSAFGVGGEMRFYILDSRALDGFSVGPTLDAFFFKNNSLGRSKMVFAIGGDFAHKWFFDSFTLEPSIGLRFGISPTAETIPGVTPFTGVYFLGCLYLGYAW